MPITKRILSMLFIYALDNNESVVNLNDLAVETALFFEDEEDAKKFWSKSVKGVLNEFMIIDDDRTYETLTIIRIE